MSPGTETPPTVSQLVGTLVQETGTLVKQELRLASAELTHKAQDAGRNIGLVSAGVAVAFAGLLALLAGAVLVLSPLLPPWTSALGLGVLCLATGYALAQGGLRKLRTVDPIPHRTIKTLQLVSTGKEDSTS